MCWDEKGKMPSSGGKVAEVCVCPCARRGVTEDYLSAQLYVEG